MRSKGVHLLALRSLVVLLFCAAALWCCKANADLVLIKTHCGKCHLSTEPEGDFSLGSLGNDPSEERLESWVSTLHAVKSGDMPPPKDSDLTQAQRKRIVDFLDDKIRAYERTAEKSLRVEPRRMNNRELNRSLADVLMIEDVGTHHPTGNLLGDTLYDGFDTHGDSLGISQFHLEQYIDAFRKVIDATILTGDRPQNKRVEVSAAQMRMTSIAQRSRAKDRDIDREFMDFRDMRLRIYFSTFKTVPETGRYRIKLRVTGKDRHVYDSAETGHHHDDPIRLSVLMGDRVRTFDLPDETIAEIELDEWLAKGTTLELSYPTDALRLRGNGNFKFQYAIGGEYIQDKNPERYEQLVKKIKAKKNKRTSDRPSHWSHWVNEWRGPRPAVYSAVIEGPFYEQWPPKRQVALLGTEPDVAKAAAVLRPIAQRAWRREIRNGELDSIARLVQTRAPVLGDLEAFKEGVVAVLVSPSFLLVNTQQQTPVDRFASKLSYFLHSTTPSKSLATKARDGALNDFDAVHRELRRKLAAGEADAFLEHFPHAWLQLDRISFMAPDPDRYPLYEKKRISDDMIGEALTFFRHAVENNVSVPDLLTADYSFINADLAKVYGVDDVAPDSQFRKHTFKDGRRGGLLGMGAFLTLTADSLGTSPIHRAVYVMENFLGIHPKPPPADVEITEPDVRQAKTIKEVLAAHTADASCASCHRSIDPYGYAFENFGPMGDWRDVYESRSSEKVKKAARVKNAALIPVDASATFRSGQDYKDIVEFRELMKSDSVSEQFVRCFVTKLLVYANGVEPSDYTQVQAIVRKSAQHGYRIVETIAAVVDSPLFREQR